MAITTPEFEQSLNDILTRMENRKRCEWCGDDQRHSCAIFHHNHQCPPSQTPNSPDAKIILSWVRP